MVRGEFEVNRSVIALRSLAHVRRRLSQWGREAGSDRSLIPNFANTTRTASARFHHHGAQRLSVWLPAGLGAQEALIESDPKRHFRPPYVGHSGWVGVVLDTRPDWGMVAWLVEQAYRLVAHPRLVAKLPPGETGSSG